MKYLQLTAKAGPDGRVRLEFPAEAGVEFDVAVVLQERTPGSEPMPTPEERGWPPGYFENVIGSIDDPAFKRYPQGEFPKREPFE